MERLIRPNRTWFDFDWAELWHYRDLLYFLIRREFVAKYKQTILGPAWFILQPLLMTLVFTVVFGRIAQIPTDGLPPVLFYLCGMLGWNYFAQTAQGTSTLFTTNEHIFSKVYFPRLIIPLSMALSQGFAWALQLMTFAAFWIYFKTFTEASDAFNLSVWALTLPLLFILQLSASMGVGLWMSALTAKYRDMQHVTTFLLQAWLYATPIIYPLSQVPPEWRWVIALNPMTGIVEVYRFAFLSKGTVDPLVCGISAFIAIALLLTGTIFYQRISRTVVDVS